VPPPGDPSPGTVLGPPQAASSPCRADAPAARQAQRPVEAMRVSAEPPAPGELEPSRPAATPGETQPVHGRRRRRTKAGFAALSVIAAAAISVPALTGCGATGPATLNYYSFPDP